LVYKVFQLESGRFFKKIGIERKLRKEVGAALGQQNDQFIGLPSSTPRYVASS
jgi:hypothetical protein